MISNARLEAALTYLAESDLSFSEALVNMDRCERKAKAVREAIFLREEGTIPAREAAAGTHTEYLEALGEYHEALGAWDYIKNKRHTEELIVDVWRSIEASRRRA